MISTSQDHNSTETANHRPPVLVSRAKTSKDCSRRMLLEFFQGLWTHGTAPTLRVDDRTSEEELLCACGEGLDPRVRNGGAGGWLRGGVADQGDGQGRTVEILPRG